MDGRAKGHVLAALALGAMLAAVAARAPGAWGVALSWGALAGAMLLWGKARDADQAAKRDSEEAERAYLEGRGKSEATAYGMRYKSGALSAVAGMLLAMASGLGALGAFAVGFGWGLLASAPAAALLTAGWIAAKNEAAADTRRMARR